MYSQFVGIDISSHDAQVAIQLTEGQMSRLCIPQTPAGFEKLVAAPRTAGCEPSRTLVVMEATGVYWMRLAVYLYEAGWQVSVINSAQAHYFARALLQRSKTDQIDAGTLSILAARLQPACWQPPAATLEAVYQRLSQRDACLRMIQQERNRLHALTRRPWPASPVVQRLHAHIAFLLDQVAELDAELQQLIAADPAWHSTATLLRSIPGFGPVVTQWLMTATHLFTACQSPEQIASYAGLVPRFHESGSSLAPLPTGSGLCSPRPPSSGPVYGCAQRRSAQSSPSRFLSPPPGTRASPRRSPCAPALASSFTSPGLSSSPNKPLALTLLSPMLDFQLPYTRKS